MTRHLPAPRGGGGGIQRALKTGGGFETAVSSANAPNAVWLAVDTTHVYWADWTNKAVYRYPKDGSGSRTTIKSGMGLPGVLMLRGNDIYLADDTGIGTGTGTWKGPKDGSSAPTPFESGQR